MREPVRFDTIDSNKNDTSNKPTNDEERLKRLKEFIKKAAADDEDDKLNNRDKKTKHSGKRKLYGKLIAVVAVVVIAGLVTFGVWQFTENQYLRSPEGAAAMAEKEAEGLVVKVGKLMQLPDGTPTIATVSDKEKLADQPFFAKAENGDKVLIYSDAGTAVIYRESENRIINSGPVAITATDTAVDGATTTE